MSRMRGDSHVRFLGEGRAATSSPYPPDGIWRVEKMRRTTGLRILLGSVMLAAVIYAVLAAPGLLTDEASTVPAMPRQIATVRP